MDSGQALLDLFRASLVAQDEGHPTTLQPGFPIPAWAEAKALKPMVLASLPAQVRVLDSHSFIFPTHQLFPDPYQEPPSGPLSIL
jgi:hypothetical protein